MKTKEQKRHEAGQRQLTHTKRIYEIGEEAYLQERLSHLNNSNFLGKSEAEKARLTKRLEKLQSVKIDKINETVPEKQTKKSKGGK